MLREYLSLICIKVSGMLIECMVTAGAGWWLYWKAEGKKKDEEMKEYEKNTKTIKKEQQQVRIYGHYE